MNMRIAMGFFAFLCIGLGLYPDPLYALLPFEVTYEPYTVGHVVTMLQLLLFSGLAFFSMLPYMKRTLTITLDFDWFYRRLFKDAASDVIDRSTRVRETAERDLKFRLDQTVGLMRRPYGPLSVLARTWPTGSMVLWAAVLLGLLAFVYFQ